MVHLKFIHHDFFMSCGRRVNAFRAHLSWLRDFKANYRKVFEGVETCHEKTCTAKSRRPNFFPHVNGEVELMRELSIRMDKMKNAHLSKEMEVNVY